MYSTVLTCYGYVHYHNNVQLMMTKKYVADDMYLYVVCLTEKPNRPRGTLLTHELSYLLTKVERASTVIVEADVTPPRCHG